MVGIEHRRGVSATPNCRPNSFTRRTKRKIVKNPRFSCSLFFYSTIRQNSITIRHHPVRIRTYTFPDNSPECDMRSLEQLFVMDTS